MTSAALTRPAAEAAAEFIRLRPITATFAFASVRADGWRVTGIMVQFTADGRRVSRLSTESGGQRYPVCTPPPGLRERLEAEIIAAFERATVEGGR